MIEQITGRNSGQDDPFRLYASPVGAIFLRKANKIYGDFPTWKYILFFFIFAVEVGLAFGLGLHLIG